MADYYAGQYQQAMEECQKNMEYVHQCGVQNYHNFLANCYGNSGFNGWGSFCGQGGLGGLGNFGGYNGYNPAYGSGRYSSGMGQFSSRSFRGNLDAGMDCGPRMRNMDAGAEKAGGGEKEFVYNGGKKSVATDDGVHFIDYNNVGGRVKVFIPGASNISISNGVMYVNGAPSANAVKIPRFTERVERQDDGREVMELELDTSNFDEGQVQVMPSLESVTVHIEHTEIMPNGTEMELSFDIPHSLPKAGANSVGLVTYFSDGVLTIEAPVTP